jgi:hypothetical protein
MLEIETVFEYVRLKLMTLGDDILVEYDYDDTDAYIMVYCSGVLVGYVYLEEKLNHQKLNSFIDKMRYAIMDVRNSIMDELDLSLDL